MGISWLAAYAAGVSTIVGAQQIMRELPRVQIRVTRNSNIIQPGMPPQPVLSVNIGNGGRRPVTIEEVSFIAKGVFLSTPSIWMNQPASPWRTARPTRCITPRPVRFQPTHVFWRETYSAGGGPGGVESDSGSAADAIDDHQADGLGGILGE